MCIPRGCEDLGLHHHPKNVGGELRQRKEAARNAIERTKTTDVPVTEGDWTDWFLEHYDEFGELMKTAPSLRRALNRRQRKQESATCCIGRACAGAALGGYV